MKNESNIFIKSRNEFIKDITFIYCNKQVIINVNITILFLNYNCKVHSEIHSDFLYYMDLLTLEFYLVKFKTNFTG